jgi:hypothetical protein
VGRNRGGGVGHADAANECGISWKYKAGSGDGQGFKLEGSLYTLIGCQQNSDLCGIAKGIYMMCVVRYGPAGEEKKRACSNKGSDTMTKTWWQCVASCLKATNETTKEMEDLYNPGLHER